MYWYGNNFSWWKLTVSVVFTCKLWWWFVLIVVDPLKNVCSVFADNVDLGTACGKYFRVCCLSIVDPGKYKGIDDNMFDLLYSSCLYTVLILVTSCVFQVTLILLRTCLVITELWRMTYLHRFCSDIVSSIFWVVWNVNHTRKFRTFFVAILIFDLWDIIGLCSGDFVSQFRFKIIAIFVFVLVYFCIWIIFSVLLSICSFVVLLKVGCCCHFLAFLKALKALPSKMGR